MHIEQSLRRSAPVVHLSILLMLGLCVGVYLICTTVVISKDSVTFIEYARNLEKDFISTVKTEYQHPGYPLLVIAVHKVMGIFYRDELTRWIYSAQIVSLLFRLAALVVLYFVGRDLAGPKYSFLSVLIFMLLPKPAAYGSDALSDWPYLLFLAFGMLMLMRGAAGDKPFFSAMAGVSAGMGYLVRPECVQLVIYGCLWAAVSWFGGNFKKNRIISSAILLVAAFAVFSAPYMGLKKAVFPKKELLQFKSLKTSSETYNLNDKLPEAFETKEGSVISAGGDLVENIGDLLMWFWLLPLLLGIYRFFINKQKWLWPESFFITSFVSCNVAMLVWLKCKYSYMSGRHVMPLVAFTSFYIPEGLESLSNWLKRSFAGKARLVFFGRLDSRQWFLILLITGIVICIPKLLKPINFDKKSYRQVSQWLAEHTGPEDAIAVPDVRISFYAGRRGLEYNTKLGRNPSEEAKYVVREIKDEPTTEEATTYGREVFSTGRNNEPTIVIYRRGD